MGLLFGDFAVDHVADFYSWVIPELFFPQIVFSPAILLKYKAFFSCNIRIDEAYEGIFVPLIVKP